MYQFNLILKKQISRLRKIVFPTIHDKELKKYFADGGDERFRYSFELNNESLVLDLGGYKGQWASDIYARYNCRILVFEPIKVYADKISERFKMNCKIEVFNIALGKSERKETISLCNDSSSTFKNSGPKEEIKFEDISNFIDKHNIENIDLIKINIEGGEYELIPRLIETGLIKKIKQIHVQFHKINKASEIQREKIYNNLAKTHTPTIQYKFVWENWVIKT